VPKIIKRERGRRRNAYIAGAWAKGGRVWRGRVRRAKTNNLIKASIKNCKNIWKTPRGQRCKNVCKNSVQNTRKKKRSREEIFFFCLNGVSPPIKSLIPPANNDDSFLMCTPRALVITQETNFSGDSSVGLFERLFCL